MALLNFVHLNTQSYWSPLGVCSPERLVQRAHELGHRALALTDVATVAGTFDFVAACDAVGIQPVLGAQIAVAPVHGGLPGFALPQVVLLVENETGWRSLLRLIHRSRLVPDREPSVRFLDLKGALSGLILLTGMPGSELHLFVEQGHLDEAEAHLSGLVHNFGREQVVVALEDRGGGPKQQALWRKLQGLAKDFGVMAVASYTVRHAVPEEWPAAAFLAGERPPDALSPELGLPSPMSSHLASFAEIEERFGNRPTVIEQTMAIAERCRFRPTIGVRRFPIPQLPRGFEPSSALVDRAFEGARQRLGGELDEEVKERLNAELHDAGQADMEAALLLLADMAAYCRGEGIPTGVGHGRLISSLLAYCLGITRINPVEHHLAYVKWPVVAGEGVRLPVEIPQRHFQRLEDYLRQELTNDCVCRVGLYPAQRAADTARELRRWVGGREEEAARDLLFLEQQRSGGRGDLSAVLAGRASVPLQDPEACAFVLGKLVARPGPLAEAGGQLALAGESLMGLCPRPRLSDGQPVTQLDSAALDLLGIPILQVRSEASLDLLDLAVSWIQEHRLREFDLDLIPLNDEETYDALAAGRTAAIGAFAGISGRELLEREMPRSFSELFKVLTDARARSETSIHDTIADCLTAFRCAFLMVHYPDAFYAAALTVSVGDSHRFHAIAGEARRAGLPLLPPDVNRSLRNFHATRQGIRAGLMAVKGMTEEAFQELTRVRDGGAFRSLSDFISRTDDKLITAHTVFNLVQAGAFDSLGEDRADLVVRALAGSDAIHAPEPPDGARPDEEDLLRREIMAAEHTLSLDARAVFRTVQKMCAAVSPDNLPRWGRGRLVHVFGRVTGIDDTSPLVTDEETVLVDIEGLVTVLRRSDFSRFEHALFSELPILVGGIMAKRGRRWYLRAATYHHIDEIRWLAESTEAVELDLKALPWQKVLKLWSIVRRYDGGSTTVEVLPGDGAKSLGPMLRAIARRKVHFTPALLDELRMLLGDDAIGLTAREGESARSLWHYAAVRRSFPTKVSSRKTSTPA